MSEASLELPEEEVEREEDVPVTGDSAVVESAADAAEGNAPDEGEGDEEEDEPLTVVCSSGNKQKS